MLRLLRGTVVECPVMPMTGMSPTLVRPCALLATCAVVLLTLCPHAHATDPPTPSVSDRRSALPPTGFTRAAVARPSVQGPSTPPRDSNAGSDTLDQRHLTPYCNIVWDLDTNTLAPYATNKPVYLRDGAVIEQAVDLRVPGPISDWGQARSYHSRVSGSEALGGKWLNGNADYQLVQEGMYDVSVIVDATSKRHFNYFTGSYTSPGDAPLTLVHDASNYELILTDWTSGEVSIFEDFYMYSTHPGKLKEKTTLAWQAAGKEGMLYTYNGSHQVTQITTGEGQDYNIVFSYTGNTIAKIEVRTGADTSTRVRVRWNTPTAIRTSTRRTWARTATWCRPRSVS